MHVKHAVNINIILRAYGVEGELVSVGVPGWAGGPQERPEQVEAHHRHPHEHRDAASGSTLVSKPPSVGVPSLFLVGSGNRIFKIGSRTYPTVVYT